MMNIAISIPKPLCRIFDDDINLFLLAFFSVIAVRHIHVKCQMTSDFDVGFWVQILLCKGYLYKDSSSTIAMIVRVLFLTCMLGPLEKDENRSLPQAGLPRTNITQVKDVCMLLQTLYLYSFDLLQAVVTCLVLLIS